MKYLFLSLCLFTNLLYAANIHINIQIKGVKDGTRIYLDDRAGYKDSTTFKNETAIFLFKKQGTDPVQIGIYTQGNTIMMAPFIDDQDVSIKGVLGEDSQGFIYTGSKTTNELFIYLNSQRPEVEARNQLLSKEGMINKSEKEINAKADSIDRIILKKDMDFTAKYPYSYLTPGLPLFAYKARKISKEEAIKWFNTLPKESRNTKLGNDFLKVINKYNILHKGDAAPELSLLDANKKQFRLSDYRDKDVLLIFWASWCAPCRAEIPNLKQIQKKNPSLQLVSFSLDDNEKEWLKAIKESNIPWINITDLGGLASVGAMAYGVPSVPHFVLIKKGIVVDEKAYMGNLLNL